MSKTVIDLTDDGRFYAGAAVVAVVAAAAVKAAVTGSRSYDAPDSTKDLKKVPGYVVKTDGRWRELKRRDEVPKKVLAGDLDWTTEGDLGPAFFKFKGDWQYLGEFMRAEGDVLKAGWTGVMGWSYSNGVFIKLSNDGERYIAGYYYLSESDGYKP